VNCETALAGPTARESVKEVERNFLDSHRSNLAGNRRPVRDLYALSLVGMVL